MGKKEWNTNDMGLCTAEWFGIVLFGKELLTCALIQPILAESLCCAKTVGTSDANEAVTNPHPEEHRRGAGER